MFKLHIPSIAALTTGCAASVLICVFGVTHVWATEGMEIASWMHNGSVLESAPIAATDDEADVILRYSKIRTGLSDEEASVGTVLFEGKLRKLSLSGVAFNFSRSCGPQPFAVQGSLSNDTKRIILTGTSIRRNANCRPVGTRDERLVFDWFDGNASREALASHGKAKVNLLHRHVACMIGHGSLVVLREEVRVAKGGEELAAEAAYAYASKQCSPPRVKMNGADDDWSYHTTMTAIRAVIKASTDTN